MIDRDVFDPHRGDAHLRRRGRPEVFGDHRLEGVIRGRVALLDPAKLTGLDRGAYPKPRQP